MAAHQAPLFTGFSRQEYWSGGCKMGALSFRAQQQIQSDGHTLRPGVVYPWPEQVSTDRIAFHLGKGTTVCSEARCGLAVCNLERLGNEQIQLLSNPELNIHHRDILNLFPGIHTAIGSPQSTHTHTHTHTTGAYKQAVALGESAGLCDCNSLLGFLSNKTHLQLKKMTVMTDRVLYRRKDLFSITLICS